MAGKIRIRLKAFDHAVIDQATADIVRTAEKTGAQVSGPDSAADEDAALDRAPLAARRQEVAGAVRAEDAQARDRHPRFAAQTVDALTKLDLPAGVDVEIKVEKEVRHGGRRWQDRHADRHRSPKSNWVLQPSGTALRRARPRLHARNS